MHVVIAHRFQNVSVDEFVAVYYSAAFNRAVAKTAGLSVRELVDEISTAQGTTIRRVRMVPHLKLPGPIEKLVTGPIEFVEVSEYDPSTKSARYHIESVADDVVQVRGEVQFTQEGGDVKRSIDGDVTVKVFAVGGLIERFIRAEVSHRYDQIQRFTQDYLDARPDTL